MRGAPAIRPKHATLTAMLSEAAQSQASLFFVDRKEQDQEVPMARVRERALSIAADLMARGVRRGDRVALVLPTCPEFVECLFGVLCAGAIPVPLYPPVRLGRLEEYHSKTAAMLRAVDAALVVTDERIRRFLGVAVQLAGPRLGSVIASSLGGMNSIEVGLDADDVALIQFSSGTTNDPKPVALTHANLLSNLAAIERYLRDEGAPHLVGVTWLPLYHDMGLIGNLLSAFYLPAPMVLLPPELFVAVPGAWLRAISRHRGTVTAAPNFAFGLCLKRIRDEELDGVDLSSWRVSLNGAEAVSAAVQRRFNERFARWGLARVGAHTVLRDGRGLAGRDVQTGRHLVPHPWRGRRETGARRRRRAGRQRAGERGSPAGRCGGRDPRRGRGVVVPRPRRSHLRARVECHGRLLRPDRPDRSGDPRRLAGHRRPGASFRTASSSCADATKTSSSCAAPTTRPRSSRPRWSRCPAFVSDALSPSDSSLPARMTRRWQCWSRPLRTLRRRLADEVASRVQERTQIRPAHVELLAPGTLPRTSSGKLRRREARTQWLAGTLTPPKKVSAARLLAAAAHGELSHARARFARRAANTPPVTTKR